MRANRAVRAWVGIDAADIVGRSFTDLLTVGGRILFDTHLGPMLSLRGEVREVAQELRTARSSVLPVLANIVAVPIEPGETPLYRATIFDATERRAYEQSLLDAKGQSDAVAARLRSLNHVISVMAPALQRSVLVDVIADAARQVLDVENVLLWLTSPGTDTLEAVRPTRWPTHAPTPKISDRHGPHWTAVHRGGAVLVRRAELRADDAALAERMDVTGHRLIILVPFRRSSTRGVISFGMRTDDTPADDDLTMLQAIADQAGASLERAELFEHQRRIALTLQRSLLPTVLPQDRRFALSGHYAPAENADEVQVGGDWYDAFWLGPDTVGLVIGDVVGRGLAAAAVMGQLRSASRAIMQSGLGPAGTLRQLDGFVAQIDGAFASTALCVEVDARNGRVRHAAAGHLPPLVVSPTRADFLLDGRGTLLGVGGVARPSEAVTYLHRGDALYLYTDGLVERPGRSIDDGMTRLAACCRTNPPVHELCDELGGSGDDSCMLRLVVHELTVRVEPRARP